MQDLKKLICRILFSSPNIVEREFPVFPHHSLEIAEILSHNFFCKNFVKAMDLLKELLNS